MIGEHGCSSNLFLKISYNLDIFQKLSIDHHQNISDVFLEAQVREFFSLNFKDMTFKNILWEINFIK